MLHGIPATGVSPDPDDNILLATVASGEAEGRADLDEFPVFQAFDELSWRQDEDAVAGLTASRFQTHDYALAHVRVEVAVQNVCWCANAVQTASVSFT